MPLKVNILWSWNGIKHCLAVYLKFLGKLVSFLAGSSIYQYLRMPAHCGDPVSSALQHSLLSQRRLKDSSVLNFKFITNAKQILETHIKYETVSTSSKQPLEKLKSQYTVLSTLGATNSNFSSSTSIPSPHGSKSLPGPSASSQHGSTSGSIDKSLPSNEPTVPVPKTVLYPPEDVVVGWKGSVPVGSGFVNLGNTCYLNSTLQALFHVPAFVNWLRSDEAHFTDCQKMNGMTHSECLICAMAKTLETSHKRTGSAMEPSSVYSKLKLICKHLNPGHQEDAHEFLRYLIEGMERSYLSIFNGIKLDNLSKETTPLGQIFGGYIRTEVTCLECKHISTTFQHFQDLILDIRTATSVEEALENYFARERLGDDGDHPYKCEQCKRRVAATKKFSLERPPKALCIQLKRFGAMGGKNNKHITIKECLDMTKFRHRPPLGSKLRYKLVSMVNHHGHSSSCGHYTALGISSSGSFYLFDDSTVQPVPLNTVFNTNPYILMYEVDSPLDTTKSEGKLISKIPSKAEQTPIANGTTNGTLSKSSSSDKLKGPASKSIFGKPTPSKIVPTNVKLSKSAPNLLTTANGDTQSSPSPSASTSNSKSQTNSPIASRSTSPHLANKPGSSKSPQKAKNGENGLRLVPYLSGESSDSECESTPLKPSPPMVTSSLDASSSTTNGWKKNEHKDDSAKGVVGGSITPMKKNGEIQSSNASMSPIKVEIEKNWASVPGRNDLPSPAGSTASGMWSVTSRNKDKIPEKLQECNSSQNGTVQSLLRLSHQGYGHSNVHSWNGSRSNMCKEMEKDHCNKRSRSPYDNSSDRGQMKKLKYHVNGSSNKEGGHRNRFQAFQNRRNNWEPPRPSRQEFYGKYIFKANNSNHRYNPYNRWH